MPRSMSFLSAATLVLAAASNRVPSRLAQVGFIPANSLVEGTEIENTDTTGSLSEVKCCRYRID